MRFVSGLRMTLALSVAALAGLLLILRPRPESGQPCPDSPRSAVPSVVHLQPNVIRHQSWVGFQMSDLAPGTNVMACVDGRIVGLRTITPHTTDNPNKIFVLTRWVDSQWLRADLDGFRDPARWTIVVSPPTG